jgi:hypothetical protein
MSAVADTSATHQYRSRVRASEQKDPTGAARANAERRVVASALQPMLLSYLH